MKNLVIIGTGGFAREASYIAKQSTDFDKKWIVKGFIKDATYNEIESFEKYHPEGILGTIDNYTVAENDVFFCAIADVDLKIRFVEKIKEKGGRFVNIIHNSAIFVGDSELGEGVFIGGNTTVSCQVKIGNYTTLIGNLAVGHDVEFGNFCHIGAYSHFGGFSIIGSRTTVHPHAVVLPKISIAENTVIGAGSIVMRNVKIPNQSLFGSPAKVLLS